MKGNSRIVTYLPLILMVSLVGLSPVGSSTQLALSPKLKPSPDGLWQPIHEASLKASPQIQ